MKLTIIPTQLHGSITPPPSKSQAHRLIICAALAEGESVMENAALSQDIKATLRCMETLGARWTMEGTTLRISGIGGASTVRGGLPRFDCGESGSTLRFLIPIALAVAGGGVFTGHGRLMERPQQPYFDLFDEQGIFHEQRGGILTVRGELEPGTCRLPGNVSSQFFSGLLLALPLLDGDSRIVSTTRLESADYVHMTCQAMKTFGVGSDWEEGASLHIPGGQRYKPRRCTAEADWSQAAFWYAAGVTVTGMEVQSVQGDRAVARFARQLREGGTVTIDVSPCPDLVPPLAAMGACMSGTLYLENAGRLRIKESDRLATVTAALSAMGAAVTEEPDRLVIRGQDSLRGGCTVDCCNDHRIAMMAAAAAVRCREPVTLLGAECVKKSYPTFWEDYQKLGGIIHEHTGE